MKKFILASLLCLSAVVFTPQAHARLIEVQSVQQFNDAFNKGNVVVDFYAPWCGPCKALAPVFSSLAQEYPNITFIKVDGDTLKGLMKQYGARSFPTLIFFKNGVKMEQMSGGKSKSTLKAILDRLY